MCVPILGFVATAGHWGVRESRITVQFRGDYRAERYCQLLGRRLGRLGHADRARKACPADSAVAVGVLGQVLLVVVLMLD